MNSYSEFDIIEDNKLGFILQEEVGKWFLIYIVMKVDKIY